MAEWDKNKHVIIESVDVVVKDTKIIIELYSYDKGEPKVALRQEIKRKNKEPIVTPVKGMSPEVALKAAIALKKLCKKYIEEDEEA